MKVKTFTHIFSICFPVYYSFLFTPHAVFGVEDGLVAYYPFNGNVHDESGNGNHGTVYGATLTMDVFGNLDGAYSFDGLDDYIAVDINTNFSDAISVAVWVYIVEPTGDS